MCCKQFEDRKFSAVVRVSVSGRSHHFVHVGISPLFQAFRDRPTGLLHLIFHRAKLQR